MQLRTSDCHLRLISVTNKKLCESAKSRGETPCRNPVRRSQPRRIGAGLITLRASRVNAACKPGCRTLHETEIQVFDVLRTLMLRIARTAEKRIAQEEALSRHTDRLQKLSPSRKQSAVGSRQRQSDTDRSKYQRPSALI